MCRTFQTKVIWKSISSHWKIRDFHGNCVLIFIGLYIFYFYCIKSLACISDVSGTSVSHNCFLWWLCFRPFILFYINLDKGDMPKYFCVCVCGGTFWMPAYLVAPSSEPFLIHISTLQWGQMQDRVQHSGFWCCCMNKVGGAEFLRRTATFF